MHLFYLREFYQKNALAKGEMDLGGVHLDLSEIKTPTYFQSSREDHIAPMVSVFKGMQTLGGEKRFIVAGSGHIAGVINHPDAHKYQYWTSDALGGSLDNWWDKAEEHPGSWWPDWDAWLSKLSGEKIPARKPGDGKLKVLDDAPGTYVKVKATDAAAQKLSPETVEAENASFND
jgi:poly[(R)-3-hydroxyalkanoate] polymerase subunit PhaC